MDFDWSEEQLARRADAIALAEEIMRDDDLPGRDLEGRFLRDGWDRFGEAGILGLSVPEAYGGTETDLLTAMLIMEGLGYGCPDNGLTFALNTQLWTVQLPIVRFGTEEQKTRYLPRLGRGEWIGAHALTEIDAGSDAFSLQMTAERTGDEYRLNGVKRFVTLGPLADVVLVFASTRPDAGRWGISAFLVERGTPGFESGPAEAKMGLRTAPFGELRFDDCVVPVAQRLGPEGSGMSVSTDSLEFERCCILASQLGAMERQLERAIAEARTRRQFGQPIGKFQSVSNRIADMKLRLETARLLMYKVAWLKVQGRPASVEAALLKLHLSESFVESGLDAIRIHAGRGYLTEEGVERDLRDAIGGIIYAGTSDIQRNIIARLLGL